MQGRPYLRFLFVEDAVGDRPIVTKATGDAVEDLYPVRPYGRLGQVAFVVDDSTNHYEASYIVYFGTVVQNDEELEDAASNADPKPTILDLKNHQVLVSNKADIYGADILFLIDDSGSMTEEIARIKAAIGKLFDALIDAGVTDIRIGVAAYDTAQKAFKTGSGSVWATFPSAAEAMITTLTVNVTGSGNYSAHHWSAINWALNNYKFRDDIGDKYIVLITDASNEGDSLTVASVLPQLNSDGIILDIIATNSGMFTPPATSTGGVYVDSTTATDWTGILTTNLGGAIISEITSVTAPTVWTPKLVNGVAGQYVLPPEEVGVGHFIYDEYHKKFYFCNRLGQFILIETEDSSSSGTGAVQVITAPAGIAITAGQLVRMNPDRTVEPAMWNSSKAVGYAMTNAATGTEVTIQIGGVFTGYTRQTLVPGVVYYQVDDGEIDYPGNMFAGEAIYPAALATDTDSFVILTEVGATNPNYSTGTNIVYLRSGTVVDELEAGYNAWKDMTNITFLNDGVPSS